MAHITETVAMYSELIAQTALLANGWTTHVPRTKEAYDILATNPATGRAEKVQVKTIRRRTDRNGDLVIYTRKGNGTTYDLAEADWIAGVLAEDGAPPRVFLLENTCQSEYWCVESRLAERWPELPISLDRRMLALLEAETVA
ncbi:hypothetical protein [Paenibacillus sp. FSL R5-0519]|uniref:hypothetical protein n=1 Tax=Paenibacillus sp. FSL R5-0519 TaxID=2921648 RepID=UPI0030DB0EB1